MSSRLCVLAALALVGCSTASSAPQAAPSIRFVGRPPTATVGSPWTARVRVTGSRRSLRVVARLGSRSTRVAVRRERAGRFRLVARFPLEGRWRLVGTIGQRAVAFGRVLVRSGELLLAQPGQVLGIPRGSLLVTERAGRDRVLRVESDSTARVFVRGVDEPYGLAPTAGGFLLSGNGGIYRIPSAGGRPTRVASIEAGPIVQGPAGEIYYANPREVGRIASSGEVQTYPIDVEVPHSVVLAGDGSLVIADSGHNRILRMNPATGASTVVAAGLRTPLGMIEDTDGAFLVAEYAAGRITRVTADGGRTPVASGLAQPYALARVGDALYVVEPGALNRPSGRLKRIGPDGRIAAVRLRLR